MSQGTSKKRSAPAGCAPLALTGCSGVQSALDPRGPAAQALAELSWIMFCAAGLIFVAVLLLLGYAVYRNPGQRRPISSTALIVGGGVVFPVVVLTALLVYGVGITGKVRATDREPALEIRVVAHQFWWEVLYPGERPGEYVATANEIRLPSGRPVRVWLTSRDVVHSFWIPNLAGKVDTIPGRVTRLTLEADAPGFFRGQCAEFCGASHAHMALEVHVLGDSEFERWLASLRRPTPSADSSAAAQGRDAFLAQGCGNCHAVRGVSQPRIAAPDLTLLATREFLGAGALSNNRENRVAWLVDGERVKPGRAMPSYAHLDARTLAAIADYLGTLR